MEFRKKPVVINATQWFRNGDYPGDHEPRGDGDPARYADYVFDTEGKVVRRYNMPNVDDKTLCKHCGNTMRQHGWIDTLEGGHIVCPGDWVITGVQGERYPCKPDIFTKTYETVSCNPIPMRKEESDIAVLRNALVGLVGADSKNELQQIEANLRMLPVPDADRVVTINAIHALLSTMPPDAEHKEK